MATKTITEVFNEVAEAIQEKKKDYTPIKPANFGKEIEDLKSGGDLVKASTLTNPNVLIHLDKLKENLPKECLNRQLHYVNASGVHLGMNFSLTGTDNYSIYSVQLHLFNLDYFYRENSQYIYHTGNGLYLSLNYAVKQGIGSTPDILTVEFYGPNNSVTIYDVEVFDGISLSELIDNMITANGSAIVDLGEISSYGDVIYSYAEKNNLYWNGGSNSTPQCNEFYEQATLADLEDVVEFYKIQEI